MRLGHWYGDVAFLTQYDTNYYSTVWTLSLPKLVLILLSNQVSTRMSQVAASQYKNNVFSFSYMALTSHSTGYAMHNMQYTH